MVNNLGMKGIILGIFVFVGAIVMTLVSVFIVMIDAQWHLGQVIQQAFTLQSLNEYYYSINAGNIPWLDFPLTSLLVLTIILYGPDVEHAIYGQSPSTYVLYFVLFIFLFLVVAGIYGLVTDRTDLDPLKTGGFFAFVIGGALITTFIAVFFVTADAQFHLRTHATQLFLFGSLSGDPSNLIQLLAATVLGDWGLFEHAVGQSASSYVLWFILFIVVYNVVAVILIWVAKRR